MNSFQFIQMDQIALIGRIVEGFKLLKSLSL